MFILVVYLITRNSLCQNTWFSFRFFFSKFTYPYIPPSSLSLFDRGFSDKTIPRNFTSGAVKNLSNGVKWRQKKWGKFKFTYASISSSSLSLFGGGFGGSPLVLTLISHFKYPLGPPVMSSGSVSSAHLW